MQGGGVIPGTVENTTQELLEFHYLQFSFVEELGGLPCSVPGEAVMCSLAVFLPLCEGKL